jgi:hypothetical protein
MTKTTCEVCARDYDLEVRHVCPGAPVPVKLVTKEKNPGFAKVLRDFADMVEKGDMVTILVVGFNGDEMVFEKAGTWANRWQILGALEYAKTVVHEC